MFRGIRYQVEKQELVQDDDRVFDKLSVRTTALHIDDYMSQRKEWKNIMLCPWQWRRSPTIFYPQFSTF